MPEKTTPYQVFDRIDIKKRIGCTGIIGEIIFSGMSMHDVVEKHGFKKCGGIMDISPDIRYLVLKDIGSYAIARHAQIIPMAPRLDKRNPPPVKLRFNDFLRQPEEMGSSAGVVYGDAE